MRIDRTNIDKFAALYKAGKPKSARRKRSSSKRVENDDHSYDATIPEGVPLYQTQRERQIEVSKYEERCAKRAKELQQHRIDRIASSFPSARRYLKTLTKIEPTTEATAFRDVDVDLAGMARAVGLAEITSDYDRFALWEVAFSMVKRVAKRAGYTAHDPEEFFASCIVPTALDELKKELRLT